MSDNPMLGFGDALYWLKKGRRAARSGWNGKGMWLILIADVHWNLPGISGERTHILGTRRLPWIGMKTADGGFVPWLASQTDLLAEDYVLIEETDRA